MEIIGLVNVCKLPGMSSHEVVYRIRRLSGVKRVGHTGTLDPAACGVLPICVGRATRLAEYIAAGPKTYRAEILLGVTTESADAEQPVAVRRNAGHLREADVLAALGQFTGVIRQHPPIHSAVWIHGVRAYNLVRQGEEFTMPEREVTIYAFTPVRFIAGPTPRLLADITCSRGTYIRSLAHDLGAALGVGGTLSFLARTQVGRCRLEEAITTDELAVATEEGRFTDYLLPADSAIPHIPALILPLTAEPYSHGTEITCDAVPDLYRVYLDTRFIGLGRVEEGKLHPVVNLQM